MNIMKSLKVKIQESMNEKSSPKKPDSSLNVKPMTTDPSDAQKLSIKANRSQRQAGVQMYQKLGEAFRMMVQDQKAKTDSNTDVVTTSEPAKFVLQRQGLTTDDVDLFQQLELRRRQTFYPKKVQPKDTN